MAEKKHWLDRLAVGISLVALAISGLTALRAFLFQRDDIRFVVNDSLKVTREKTDFKLDEDQSFTFINSGTRPALISGLYGTLVLVTNPKAECEGMLAKSIILDSNEIVVKPGEIQPLHAKVLADYPWKKEKDGFHFREDKEEPGSKYIVCIEFYVTTPDSSSLRWVQPLYSVPADNGSLQLPSELFGKDEPLSVLQRTRWGFS
jgi:hypothetical protein